VSISTLLKHLRMPSFNMFCCTVKLPSNIVSDTCCAGRAEWTDVNHTECLVLWRSIHGWANYILNFVSVYPFLLENLQHKKLFWLLVPVSLKCYKLIILLIRIVFVAK
jgi:hypothetical protein